MKKVFLIHGWGGHVEEGWFPWLKASLEKEGLEVSVPVMPDTNNPKIDEWVDCLRETVGDFDQDTYFVGHSIGCQAILRFLEKAVQGKCGGVIMVAPWVELFELETEEEDEIASRWDKSSMDAEKIKKKADKIFAIFSDNDPCVPLEANRRYFENEFGAEVIIEKGKRHFSGDDDINELPVVLCVIRNL